jgi:hypothetical protein
VLTPLNPCPRCGEPLDAAINVHDTSKPKEGDLSVCYYCGAFLQFDAFLQVQLLSPAEAANLLPDVLRDLVRIRKFVIGE